MSHRIFRLFLSLVIMVGLVAVERPRTVGAAGPWFVSTTGDDNNDCLGPSTPCATINAAIGKASSGDTVNVAEGTYLGSGTEVVLIDKSITLAGGWDSSFAAQNGMSAIDGENSRRGVTVNNGVSASIDRFTIQFGNVAGNGGGINNSGSLTVTNSIISNNTVGNGTGNAIFNTESGILTVNDTIIRHNGSDDACWALANYGIWSMDKSIVEDNTSTTRYCARLTLMNGAGAMTITETTVRNNLGGIYNYASVTLVNSVVSGNTGADGPGGIYSWGGNLVVTNSTISGNTTGSGGGIFAGGGGTVKLSNATLSSNTAGTGGGIYNHPSAPAEILMQNTIVSGNTSSTGADCSGAIGSLGYNLVGDTSNCDFTPTTGDLTSTDAKLGLLVGSPAYHPLMSDSPAIDAGNPAGCTDQDGNPLSTDQRGIARVDRCDIGAYEYTTPGPAANLLLLGGDAQSTITTVPFPMPLQVAALDAQGSPAEGVTIDFVAPESGPSATFADTGTTTTSVVTNGSGVATTSTLTANEQAGSYIITASATGIGSVNFNLDQVGRPTNDDFANAEIIPSLPFNDAVDSTNATLEPNEPSFCATSGQTRSLWYSFTPATDMVVSADMFGSTFSDTNLAAYQSSGPGFDGLSFLRAACFGNSMYVNVQAGTTYYFQAEYYASSGGDLHLNLQQIPPPANDNFADAVAITPLPFSATVDIAGATIESNEPQNCSFMNKTAWYSFTATETVNIRVETPTPNSFLNIYLATGPDITDLQHIKCMGSGEFSTFLVDTGETYYVQVSSFFESGSIQLDVREAFPAQNDAFANAESIPSLPFMASPDLTDTGTEPGEPQDCGQKNHTVWYSFTPSETMSIRADSESSNAFMSLYRANGSAISDLQAMPCISFGTPTIFQLEAGVTYYLQVGFAFGTSASIQIDLQRVFPPANDSFAGAQTINAIPFNTTADVTNAWTEENEPQYCAGMNRTVWYVFTPAETMSIRADTLGSGYGANLNVYHADGPGISDLTFLDCAASGGSALFLAEAGQTYYLQVGSMSWDSATIQINLQQAFPPANDIFANAAEITSLPFSDTLDAINSSTEPGEPQFLCYFMEKTVWYRFTPNEDIMLRADMLGSSVQGNVNIFSANGPGFSGLQFLQCSGPAGSPTFLAEAGTTYYLQAGPISGSGAGNITVNLTPAVPPQNDNFTNSETVTTLPFSAAVQIPDATIEPNEPQYCYNMQRTVWYAFTPAENVKLRVNTSGSAIYGNVNIYQATGTGISDLQFLNCTGPFSEVAWLAEAGQTYYFQVGAAFGETGGIQFNLAEVPVIHGRVVDEVSTAPVPGDTEPFALVALYRVCGDGCLEYINAQTADSEGRFMFDSYYFGQLLSPGTYKIEVSANQYQTEQFGPFEFTGDSLDVGDLPISPPPLIGSINGRVVDAASGSPISTDFGPSVNLYRCDPNCSWVNSAALGADGRFHFETDIYGNRLLAGEYQIQTNADQYFQLNVANFTVGENVDYDLGNIRVTSFPVRYSRLQPCDPIPAAGGECEFSVLISNGTDHNLKGKTWGTANVYLPESFIQNSQFQIKDAQDLDLGVGRSKVFRFRLKVPENRSSTAGSVCGSVFVGEGNQALFNTLGYRSLFCITRQGTGFAIVNHSEVQSVQETLSLEAVSLSEVEPNNSCQTAQDMGSINDITTVDGLLDSSASADIDFYRFNGTPSARFNVDHEGQATGKGTLGDPLLGFFDSNCNLLDYNDDSGSLNSHLAITVPPDGVFILAATSYPDFGFNGGGDGSYQLTVAPETFIGSIGGVIVDAVSGQHLSGQSSPYTHVGLVRCETFGCFATNEMNADANGEFRFETDYFGNPLRSGAYYIWATASQYQNVSTAIFTVGRDEQYNVGNVAMQSNPVRFSDVVPCNVPSSGGICDFSVRVTNGLATRLSGKAWNMIHGFQLGSFADVTAFQTETVRDISLDPGRSTVLRFRFQVRGNVQDGAVICAETFVGQNPDPYYNTVGEQFLFCFQKGSAGFTLMSPQDTQSQMRPPSMPEVVPRQVPIQPKHP